MMAIWNMYLGDRIYPINERTGRPERELSGLDGDMPLATQVDRACVLLLGFRRE